MAICRNEKREAGNQFINCINPIRPKTGAGVGVSVGGIVGTGVHVATTENVGGGVDVGKIGRGVLLSAIVGMAVMVGMGVTVGRGGAVGVGGKKSARFANTIVPDGSTMIMAVGADSTVERNRASRRLRSVISTIALTT